MTMSYSGCSACSGHQSAPNGVRVEMTIKCCKIQQHSIDSNSRGTTQKQSISWTENPVLNRLMSQDPFVVFCCVELLVLVFSRTSAWQVPAVALPKHSL